MSSAADDPRLGDVIEAGFDGDIVLIGYPYDIGNALDLFRFVNNVFDFGIKEFASTADASVQLADRPR